MVTKNFFFLIGLPGSGKTTLGKRLANALKLNFMDSDQEIIKTSGTSISLIFDLEGEAEFRKYELAVIKRLALLDNIVLSTGGGAILDTQNRNVLKERGVVIYLHCSPILLSDRIRKNNRPLFQGANIIDKYISLYEQRHKLYSSIADLELIINNNNIGDTFNRLLSLVREKYY